MYPSYPIRVYFFRLILLVSMMPGITPTNGQVFVASFGETEIFLGPQNISNNTSELRDYYLQNLQRYQTYLQAKLDPLHKRKLKLENKKKIKSDDLKKLDLLKAEIYKVNQDQGKLNLLSTQWKAIKSARENYQQITTLQKAGANLIFKTKTKAFKAEEVRIEIREENSISYLEMMEVDSTFTKDVWTKVKETEDCHMTSPVDHFVWKEVAQQVLFFKDSQGHEKIVNLDTGLFQQLRESKIYYRNQSLQNTDQKIAVLKLIVKESSEEFPLLQWQFDQTAPTPKPLDPEQITQRNH